MFKSSKTSDINLQISLFLIEKNGGKVTFVV